MSAILKRRQARGIRSKNMKITPFLNVKTHTYSLITFLASSSWHISVTYDFHVPLRKKCSWKIPSNFNKNYPWKQRFSSCCLMKTLLRSRSNVRGHQCGNVKWIHRQGERRDPPIIHHLINNFILSPSGRQFRLTSQNSSSVHCIYWSRHKTLAMHNPAHDTSLG